MIYKLEDVYTIQIILCKKKAFENKNFQLILQNKEQENS